MQVYILFIITKFETVLFCSRHVYLSIFFSSILPACTDLAEIHQLSEALTYHNSAALEHGDRLLVDLRSVVSTCCVPKVLIINLTTTLA